MLRNRCPLSELPWHEPVTDEAKTRDGSLPGLPEVSLSLSRPNPAAAAPAAADSPLWDLSFPRCSVKGCIFPAASPEAALCLVHELAEREPDHFLSVQPTTMCLDRAKYGVAETEFDNSRGRDRRALALQLDRFRNEVA